MQNSFILHCSLQLLLKDKICRLKCFLKSLALACVKSLEMVSVNQMSNGPTLLINNMSLVAADCSSFNSV